MIISGFNGFNAAPYNQTAGNSEKKFNAVGASLSSENSEIKGVNSPEKNEILKMLSELPKEDEIKTAAKHYSHLQAILLSRISRAEQQIDRYNELNDEIGYYEKLLGNSDSINLVSENSTEEIRAYDTIVVESAKYGLEHLGNNSQASRSEIEKLLEKAKSTRERMAEPPRDRIYKLTNTTYSSLYRTVAEFFTATTGMTADCLDVSGDESLNNYQSGTTVENYVDKKKEVIENLKSRSNGLYQLMEDYKLREGLDKEDELFGNLENYKMNAIEEIRNEFLTTGRIALTESTVFLLETLSL